MRSANPDSFKTAAFQAKSFLQGYFRAWLALIVPRNNLPRNAALFLRNPGSRFASDFADLQKVPILFGPALGFKPSVVASSDPYPPKQTRIGYSYSALFLCGLAHCSLPNCSLGMTGHRKVPELFPERGKP